MRKKSDFILRLCLIIGDALTMVFSFACAYFIRTNLDPRPYFFVDELYNFTLAIVFLIPILLIILSTLGLYQKKIFMHRSLFPELGRIFISAVLSVSALITFDFFYNVNLFPVRIVAIYAMVICFFALFFERQLIRGIARQIFKNNYGTQRVVVIGNHKNTDYLTSYISAFPESGYCLVGIVASKKFVPKDLLSFQYSCLKEVFKSSHPDIIFQTDEKRTEYVYKQAINHHLRYYFVPSETALSSHFGDLELIGNIPAVLVKTTPLSGSKAVLKRSFDIIFSLVALFFAIIPIAIIWLLLKISEPEHSPIYSDYRLTRYNKKFKCFKFRSMKHKYNGITAEEAFKNMGHPELIEKYRKNGDYLKDDPRITKIGHFLRCTSLDELPQLFNILRGDISLIGPRALLPNELRDYGDRSLILTVKSGLTGLAQVSGRRNIPFGERRSLDIYYVKNWSLALDLQIFFKTIAIVLRGEGAK